MRKGSHVRYYIETRDGADTITRLPRNAPDSVFDFYVGDTIVTPPLFVKADIQPAELTVTPNPAREVITIRTQTNEAVFYKITDALGREIITYDAAPNTLELRIRLDKFSSGTYYIQARSASGKFVRNVKFIILP